MPIATPPPAQLESVACYVCGASESVPWAEENGFFAGRCRQCGLVYVSPRPTRDAISLAAQSGLHEGDANVDETGQREEGKVNGYRKRLRDLFPEQTLARRSQAARWLDIGCGFGEFMEALALESASRLAIVGSEPNERKAAAARSRGLDVMFRDLASEREKYDFVSLLNVFSHLPQPPELLRQLSGMLRPGGELVLQTGNWAELERADIPDRLHLPDHLSFASEQLVRRLLESAAFSLVSVRRYPMFRPKVLARLKRAVRRERPAPGACDLWFRARVNEK
jgi:SAM-dependent methyltransferase